MDYLLDLTDEKVLDKFGLLWEKYCDKEGCNINQPLGLKSDKMFDFFEIFDSFFKVIKVYGKYPKTPEKDFLKYIPRKKQRSKSSTLPTHKVKTIYCVRDYNFLCNRELLEVIENEKYEGY